jgi:phosphohistidine phosphatase
MGEPRRTLWLLRHAKTEREPPRGGSDHERRLSQRGRRDADALAARLGKKGDMFGFAADDLPTLVLSSTATRAVQTAERALARMVPAPVITTMRSLYGAEPDDVLDEVRLLDDALTSVMVVGHNPTFHDLAAGMAPPDETPAGLRDSMPTCALAVFALSQDHWTDVRQGTAELIGLFAPPF